MSYRLPDAADKPAYVQARFDAIARRYDLFNDLITQGQHRWWKRTLVNRVAGAVEIKAPGVRGLDLCCGTGDIAQRALAGMGMGAGEAGGTGGANGGMVMLDFSANMLSIAQNRLRRAGTQPARRLLTRGDAMALPFEDGAFQFVTVGFGLRNVSDLGGCLQEIHRVLAPGGVLASLDVGKVRPRWIKALADLYFFRVVPLIGRMIQPGEEMFTYLPESSRSYPSQEALAAILAEHGFQRVEVLNYMFGSAAIHLARKPG
ncbi:MAG: ubiquinone/menaquinone biosynthesis methyltransferase [Deltaproteobacteria bacterium]|nr:ubiquinone/menaquinone biosynthesis methyltransferase [Deltaproteobacteria bacterium]